MSQRADISPRLSRARALRTRHPGVAASFGVFVVALTAFLSTGAVLPVLPSYVRGPLHSGDFAVGIVVGAYAITSIVCRPLAGRQADRRGRRVVLLTGTLALATGGVLYLLSDSVPSLIGARLVVGIGEGCVYTAGATWAVDLAPADRRGLALGLFGLAVWGGLSLGPVAGELLRNGLGYSAVWTFVAVLPACGALVALRLPEPARPRPAGAPAAPWPALLPAAARRPGLALALANFGYAALAGFAVLALKARGIDDGAIVFTVFAVAVFASRVVFGRMPDRRGPRRTACVAGVLEALGLASVGAAHSLVLALVGALVMGLGFSMLFPSLALMVVGDVSEERRGAAMGAFTAFFDLGVGLGGPIAGATAALAGYAAVFYLAALAALGTVVLVAMPVRVWDPLPEQA
jgi:MFS family permease